MPIPVIGALIGSLVSGAGRAVAGRVGGFAAQQAVKAGAQGRAPGFGAEAMKGASEALTNRMSALDFGGSLGLGGLDSWFPTFAHSIRVTVAGGPDATLQRTWQLACAAAFGRLRDRISTFAGTSVNCVWDITGKAVSIEIQYSSNGLTGWLGNQVAGAFEEDQGRNAIDLIQAGPSPETVGGGFPDFLQNFGQIFGNGPAVLGRGKMVGGKFVPAALNGNAPGGVLPGNGPMQRNPDRPAPHGPLNLPDDGRLITTSKKTNPDVQPPRPPDDLDLVALVANALTPPCELPAKPPHNAQVDKPQGFRVYSVGARPSRSYLMGRLRAFLKPNAVAVDNAVAALPLPPVKTLDGYVTNFAAQPDITSRSPVNGGAEEVL